VPIEGQSTQQRAEVDRTDSAPGDALAEAQGWLQSRGAAGGQPSSRAPAEGSTPSDDGDVDAESIARSIALRRLTARSLTRHELDQALQAKNVPPGVKETVLDRMQEVGLIDDASFAVDWVASRQRRRHLSRRVLRRELETKGVEPDDIDRALDDVGLDAELTVARDLVGRRRAAMSALARDVQYRRLAGLLSRRGFDASVIRRVLTDVSEE
jgi:regulatory protein